MKYAPQYSKYFTQGTGLYEDWSWLADFDYGWIDRMNEERSKERALIPGYGVTCSSSDLDEVSKDFDSINFPSPHEWPEDFKAKYDATVASCKAKIDSIAKTAQEIAIADDVTVYLDCEDGHHYFSTPYHAYGSIRVASIDKDSPFDSVDTAVYAFINDYRDWEKEYGDIYRKAETLSRLESLKSPVKIDYSSCQHEDLGSLGYKHGDTVICPFCGKLAEVW